MTNAILRGCLFIGGAAALLLWTAPDSFGLEVNKPVRRNAGRPCRSPTLS